MISKLVAAFVLCSLALWDLTGTSLNPFFSITLWEHLSLYKSAPANQRPLGSPVYLRPAWPSDADILSFENDFNEIADILAESSIVDPG